VIPTLASRHPLWEDRLGNAGIISTMDRGMLLDEGKETIATTALDAAPDMVLEMPEDSFAPLLLTLGLTVLFVALLLKVWLAVGLGAAIAALALLAWFWPRSELRERTPAHG
jgi:cytochrome c oxidase subunit 1/cytochrome c oxidase subunit I+III